MTEQERIERKYYLIKVEGTSPVEMTYKILAEDPQEALSILEKGFQSPCAISPKTGHFRKKRAQVYNLGTTTIMATKNY